MIAYLLWHTGTDAPLFGDRRGLFASEAAALKAAQLIGDEVAVRPMATEQWRPTRPAPQVTGLTVLAARRVLDGDAWELKLISPDQLGDFDLWRTLESLCLPKS